MINKNPQLAQQQPYKAIIEKDKAYLAKVDEATMAAVILKSLSGISEAEFDRTVQHTVYRPKVELLKYLRSNGFKTYICSVETIEFVRIISRKYYGISAYQEKDNASLNAAAKNKW